MIPLKLEIKNFLSYGPSQIIDFQPYSLICLCGKNGHGKSALLDAITWAVWGQARKISGTVKPDLQLLRLGQTTMMVNFDFEFNGQHYTIRREFAKNHGKQYASLDFGMLNEEGKSINLTDKTIKLTQNLIEKTLGLTYESFINSAFLRQGQSNEFSKKSPKERKEILSAILGLEKYELLRKTAFTKVRTLQNQVSSLLLHQETLKHDLLQKPDLENQFKSIIDQLITFDQDLAHLHTLKKNLSDEKQLLDQQHHALKTFKMHLEQLMHIKKKQEEHLLQLVNQWRTTHKQLLKTHNKNKLEHVYQSLKTKIDQHQQILQEHLNLNNLLLTLKEKEQKAYYALAHAYQKKVEQRKTILLNVESEKKIKLAALNRTNQLISNLYRQQEELNTMLVQLEPTVHQATIIESNYALLEKKFEKRKIYYHRWAEHANHLHQELKQLHQKQELSFNENPSCPLCEQNLSAARKKFLKTKFDKLSQSLIHRFNRFNRILKLLKTQLMNDHEQKEVDQKNIDHTKIAITRSHEIKISFEKIKNTLQEAQQEHTQLTHELQTIEKNLKDAASELDQIIAQEEFFIKQDKDYSALQNDMNQVVQKINNTRYDSQQHQHDSIHLQQVEQQLQQHHLTEQEQLLQQHRMHEIKLLCAQLKEKKKELSLLHIQLHEFAHLGEQQNNFIIKEQTVHEKYLNLQSKRENLFQERGRLEQALRTIASVHQRHQEQEQQVISFNQEITDYQTIIHALGKDGIQGLLIEQVIPEIEQEANRLLSQLTDNQAHIFIEPLRDLQKGGTKETLDIKIADNAGIRPYELFSGGEAFRIDFALRISISKLLARRAGTSLQTLIIDEGFGSQDEDGLHHIMDAIHKIRDNFCKIIVVSHLPSMKDQFPVHFLVQKEMHGSFITVIEQG